MKQGVGEKGRIDWQETGLLAVGVTVLAIVASLVLGKVSEVLSLEQALIGSGMTVFLLLSIFALSYRLIMLPMITTLRAEKTELTAGFDTLSSRFDAVSAIFNAHWLITNRRLMEIESTTESKEIWIITRSLEEEIEESLYGSIIRSNIARGVKYTYFVPGNPIAPVRVQKLISQLGGSENVTYKVVSNPLFDIVSAQDIAIFGPTGPDSHKMKGYMNLPIKERGTDYFIELGPQHCEQIVAILLSEGKINQ